MIEPKIGKILNNDKQLYRAIFTVQLNNVWGEFQIIELFIKNCAGL